MSRRVLESAQGDSGGIPLRVWIVQCHYCGYEPLDQVGVLAQRCPKCHQSDWERIGMPGAMLTVAEVQGPQTNRTSHLVQR